MADFPLSNKCFVPAKCSSYSMQVIISKRSSSSVDLTSSSRDDVPAERAAIALSVGVSWQPARRRRSRGRPGWQQLWDGALQEHILHHHELPHAVRSQRPCWWRPGYAIAAQSRGDNPRQHSTAATAAPAAALAEDELSGSSTKRRKIHVNPSCATGSST